MSPTARRRGAKPPCAGACFAIRRHDGAANLACLSTDLGRAWQGRTLRWAAEVGSPQLITPRSAVQDGCPLGLTITAYGVQVGVRTNDHTAWAKLRERLPPSWRPAAVRTVECLYSLVVTSPRGFQTLYADAICIARGRRLDAILDAFEANLQSLVAERARRYVFVHAGAVGWRGRAILLPGRSMAGKTTLVTELIRAGATYFSDEYAVLDGRGRVYPFARPLRARTEEGGRERREPQAMGIRVGRRSLPVGLIVVTRYRPGARWRPRALQAGEGALRLLANAVTARRAPVRTMAAVQAVVSEAPVLQGVRGEAQVTARTLLDHLETFARGLTETEQPSGTPKWPYRPASRG